MRDNVGDAVGDALRSVMLFVPKAVAFVAILVVGWLIARAASKVVNRILERVGFDRAVERGGIRRALSRSRYDASDLVARLVQYALLLVTLQLAFGIWGPNPVSDLIAAVIAWLPRAFVAVVIVVVAAAIASAVRDVIGGALGGLSYGRALATVAYVFLLGLGAIAALDQIGVATAITTPVLIAVLATLGGILVVGVGGGLIRPMQSRWETSDAGRAGVPADRRAGPRVPGRPPRRRAVPGGHGRPGRHPGHHARRPGGDPGGVAGGRPGRDPGGAPARGRRREHRHVGPRSARCGRQRGHHGHPARRTPVRPPLSRPRRAWGRRPRPSRSRPVRDHAGIGGLPPLRSSA